ncbi:NAD(P)H-dependent oxidoreductase [Shewanella zhangzhouensis]|uniref:NAD(P)H-dependent oxidoreductase n=1 Tax=Shewanella zhangzhouensis TaxID=2864213 RepID=UPI001C65A0A1|nr:NAD(P)H-dependent oxidoreductase [Shewanella zhangzhouensis]QYK07016.1 NAD(P)H-dependent oxidoreductase [Shewanella zhangzhouensis]
MNVLIVYWHPEPLSFNNAMFRTSVETLKAAGHSVKTSDLHDMNFFPVSGRHNFTSTNNTSFFKQQMEEIYATDNNGFVPEIEMEIQKLEWCDLVIFQFPLWWFGMPAMLKGWVERVFSMGRAYGGGRFYEDGIFRGKKAMLSITTGGLEELYVKGGWNGDIDGILRPIHRGILEFTGFSVLAPQIVFGPARTSDLMRHIELEKYAIRLKDVFKEKAIDVGSY